MPGPDRIIEVAQTGAHLSVETGRLVISVAGTTVDTVPLGEVAALVLGNPALSLTHAVLSELAARGVPVVITDGRRLPAGMVLPMAAHSTQAERLRLQVEARLPRKKRIWQAVVKAKIRAQATVLDELTGSDGGLRGLARRVRSGDAGNVEAEAARRYWPRLFGAGFRRHRDGGGVNPLLNYGYAVLRALVARAVCGAGLHPSLGVHHHNRYDPFCLASDLMEPFRPWVDRVVATRWRDDPPAELTPEAKRELLSPLLGRYDVGGEKRTLFDLAGRVAVAFLDALRTGQPKLPYPEGPPVTP